MSSPTYDTLRAAIITAMKARDTATATALRTMDAAIQRAAMDTGKEIDEALVIATFRKAVKNLTDARTEFEKGGRPDLVATNSAEIAILEKYLPKGLDAANRSLPRSSPPRAPRRRRTWARSSARSNSARRPGSSTLAPSASSCRPACPEPPAR
jgi:hypothetical protein